MERKKKIILGGNGFHSYNKSKYHQYNKEICNNMVGLDSICAQTAITLIALVVTIIILLILAGVSIATLIGDNGLLNRTKDAKIATEIASIKEEIQTDILGKQAENEGNISDSNLETILLRYGTLSNEGRLIDKILTTTKGNYEIKVADIFNGTTVKDAPLKPYALEETMGGANSPNISGFNVENTYYVTWGTTAPYQINETSTINHAPPSGWSNYNGKEWANVKTTGGKNDCYWVWIPRYAYCITTGYQSNEAGTIDIKFLKGTTNTPIDGTSITISNSLGAGNWNVHPAFWWDKDNDGIEDDGEQLTGIWVAKFEASSNSSQVFENPTVAQLAIDGGSATDIDLKVRVKPNVTSWRGITVNNIFTVCRNLTTSGNSLEGVKGIDTHIMKNTEWGAVAYLSRSVYGKNGEVWNNPYYNNETNYSPITGLCSNESNGKDNATTDINKTCKYNEAGGKNASTTGNVYGVYDMAGGAWEYVAGIYKGTTSDDLGNSTVRSNLWDPNNSKYVDQYTETIGSQSTYYGNTNKYGDAVYETSSSGGGDYGSWDSSETWCISSSWPVFIRGGIAHIGSRAGVFAFRDSFGGAYTNSSFRPVVISF